MCTVVADIAVHIVVHIAEHIDVYIGVHIDVHIDLHIGEQIAEHMGWSIHYNAFQFQLKVNLILYGVHFDSFNPFLLFQNVTTQQSGKQVPLFKKISASILVLTTWHLFLHRFMLRCDVVPVFWQTLLPPVSFILKCECGR